MIVRSTRAIVPTQKSQHLSIVLQKALRRLYFDADGAAVTRLLELAHSVHHPVVCQVAY